MLIFSQNNVTIIKQLSNFSSENPSIYPRITRINTNVLIYKNKKSFSYTISTLKLDK